VILQIYRSNPKEKNEMAKKQKKFPGESDSNVFARVASRAVREAREAKPAPVFIEVSGGVVSSVKNCKQPYAVIDWDSLLGDAADTPQEWKRLSRPAQRFIESEYPEDFDKIQDRIASQTKRARADAIANRSTNAVLAKPYTVKKLFGVWRVITPSGNAVVVGHSSKREANVVANVFNHTKRDEKTVVAISLSALDARAGLISESDEN